MPKASEVFYGRTNAPARMTKKQARLEAAERFMAENDLDPALRISISKKATPKTQEKETGPRNSKRLSYPQRLVKLKKMRENVSTKSDQAALDASIQTLEGYIKAKEDKGEEVEEDTRVSFDCTHSSMAVRAEYSVAMQTLEIEYSSDGAVVTYFGVPPKIYAELENAERNGDSVGKAIWRLIRGTHGGAMTWHGSLYDFSYTTQGSRAEPKDKTQQYKHGLVSKREFEKVSGLTSVGKRGPKETKAAFKKLGAFRISELVSKEDAATQAIVESRRGERQTRYARGRFKDHQVFIDQYPNVTHTGGE